MEDKVISFGVGSNVSFSEKIKNITNSQPYAIDTLGYEDVYYMQFSLGTMLYDRR